MSAYLWRLTDQHAVLYTQDRGTLDSVLAYPKFPYRDPSQATTYSRGNGRVFAWQFTFPSALWNGLVRHLGRARVTYLESGGPPPAPSAPEPMPAAPARRRPSAARAPDAATELAGPAQPPGRSARAARATPRAPEGGTTGAPAPGGTPNAANARARPHVPRRPAAAPRAAASKRDAARAKPPGRG